MRLSSPAPTGTSRRLILAALIPLAAFALQWFFWAAIQPYVWFLFFPAVFFSSWVGGVRGGLVATVLSAGLVWYFFIPPQFSFGTQNPMSLVSIGMFVVMGVLFSLFHGRLWKANQQAANALAAVEAANHQLEARVLQRTAELQQANAELAASETRFRVMTEQSAEGVALINADGMILYFTPASARLLGQPPGALLDRSVWEFLHPDEHEFLRQQLAQILSAPATSVTVALRWRLPDGAWRWLEVTGTNLLAEPGLEAIVINYRDITGRKQAEVALQESHERYHLLFDRMLDGFALHEIICDPQGRPCDYRFLELNPAFERLTGLKASDVIGRTVLQVLPDIEPVWVETYGRVALTGESIRFENYTAALDKHFEVVVFQPCPNQFATIFADITSRTQAEDELARHRDRLEHLVAERTNDLTDSRTAALSLMQDAQRQERRVAEALAAQRVLTAKLDEANKELESFSYSVSHDLRAPLRHVHGYVEMLQRATAGQLSDQAGRYLNTISDASVEMGQLIDDLLAFSRVGRTEMHESTVHLDAMVQDAIRGLEMATRSRNIVWQATPLPPVVGDPALLKQVLVNLIGNAVKYSGKRDPAHIEIGCAGEDNGQVILFVRDNGVGFDMQYAHKLFGVFQRLHRAEEFEGTGIGLATVRRIVARHGGRVWAEGALNQGATFYVTLKPSRTA